MVVCSLVQAALHSTGTNACGFQLGGGMWSKGEKTMLLGMAKDKLMVNQYKKCMGGGERGWGVGPCGREQLLMVFSVQPKLR